MKSTTLTTLTTLIKFLTYDNILTATEAVFLQNAQHRIDLPTPESRQTETSPGLTIRLYSCISCNQSRHRHNMILFLSTLHERRARTVGSNGHWLVYVNSS
jgi:hypothetical protein